MGIDEPIRITVPRGRYDDLEAVLDLPDDIEAPIAVGDSLGVLRVALDDEILAERSLLAQTAVEEAGFFSRRGDDLARFFGGLFGDSGDVDETAEHSAPDADAVPDS